MDYHAASGLEPDHNLTLRDPLRYDGLEFVQFYIFVKDGESKYAKDQVAVYEIYKDQCE